MFGKVGRKGGGGGRVQRPTPTKRPKRTHHEKIEVARPEEQTNISIADSLISERDAKSKAKSTLVVKEKNAKPKAPQTEVPKDFKRHQKQMEKALKLQREIDKVRKEHLLGKPEVEQNKAEVKKAKVDIEVNAQVNKFKRMSFEKFRDLYMSNNSVYERMLSRLSRGGIQGKLATPEAVEDQILRLIYTNLSDEALDSFFARQECSEAFFGRYMFYHVAEHLINPEKLIEITKKINTSIQRDPNFLRNFVNQARHYDSYGVGLISALDAQSSSKPIITKESLPKFNKYFEQGAGKLMLFIEQKGYLQEIQISPSSKNKDYFFWAEANERLKWDASVWKAAVGNCEKYGSPEPTFIQRSMVIFKIIFKTLFGHSSSQDKGRG